MKNYIVITLMLLLDVTTTAQAAGPKPSVYVFVQAECPCIYTHKDSFGKLLRQYSGQVNFSVIFVGEKDSQPQMEDLLHQLNWKVNYRKDKNHKLVNTYKPAVSSDCVVTNANGDVVYKGAIDDGIKNMGQIKNFYLSEVIHAVLQGKQSPYSNITGVGCKIM